MGYDLQAVLGATTLLREVLVGVAGAKFVALRQGLALAPMTDELFDALTCPEVADDRLGFWKMPNGFVDIVTSWSHRGPVGYVEAEYFGGVGTQRSAVWSRGERVLGPLVLDAGERAPREGTPLSRALRTLGANATGFVNEFAAVGLDRYRRLDDWADEAEAPPSAGAAK